MDCLIDLHLHLDGSLSLKAVKELAKIQNIPLNLSDTELIKKLQVSSDCSDLNEYLEKFEFPLTLLQTKEAIKYAVYNLQEELKEKGFIYAEIRFAPQLHTNNGFTQEEVVRAAINGLNSSDFKANLILCAMRSDSNHSQNIETLNLVEKYLGQGVCALDLAGAEGLYPTENFRDIFEMARERNIPFTIHAGEADGPQSIYTAIDSGAKRIGHGVRAFEKGELIKKLAETKIPLELCPTSNLNTGIFKNIGDYPLMYFINNGVIVTVNSDNMTVSSTDVRKELKLLKNTFSLTTEDIKKLLLNSANAAFADAETKKYLITQINNSYV